MNLLKNTFFSLIALLLVTQVICGQELEMNVRVLGSNTLTITDKNIFPQMERSIKELMNNQKWTNDVFESVEKIRCKLQMTVKQDLGNNNFIVDLFIESYRPVHSSSYETPMISVNEKDVPILFDPFKPLENSRDAYIDNFSAILTFYAYYILAMDYDSFSLEGGDPYINILQNMINSLPGGARSLDDSWNASSKKKFSRYFLMENMTNLRLKPFRRAFYEYHRLCLDNISKSPDQSRAQMTSAIETIAATDQSYPNSFLMQNFIASKRAEIVEIFKKGNAGEKTKIIAAMSAIDPSNTSLYNSIKS